MITPNVYRDWGKEAFGLMNLVILLLVKQKMDWNTQKQTIKPF